MKQFTDDELYKLYNIRDRIQYADNELRKLHLLKRETLADTFKPNPTINNLRIAIEQLATTLDLFEK